MSLSCDDAVFAVWSNVGLVVGAVEPGDRLALGSRSLVGLRDLLGGGEGGEIGEGVHLMCEGWEEGESEVQRGNREVADNGRKEERRV